MAIADQVAGDLDHLLMADTQLADRSVRVDRIEADLRHGFDGGLAQLLATDPAAVARQVVEKQVFRHRQGRQQIEFLHDHAHAQLFSLGTAARAVVLPWNCIWPVVGVTRPPMIFDSVLLPAPFSPVSASTSPRISVRSMPASTGWA
jgi:hypothetical protein